MPTPENAFRTFRAIMPSGKEVSIRVPSLLNAQPDHAIHVKELADLLASRKPTERGLEGFIRSSFATIFDDADPAVLPTYVPFIDSNIHDLMFALKDGSGFASVKVKSHLADWGVATTAGKPMRFDPQRLIRKWYVIASRRTTRQPKHAVEMLNHLSHISVITWDDVVERLSSRSSENLQDDLGLVVMLSVTIEHSRKLLKMLAQRPEWITGVEDRDVERLMATLLHDLGFTDVFLTPARKDGGKDVVATWINASTRTTEKYLFECKHWLAGGKVHLKLVTRLQEVVKSDSATGGVVVARGGFGPELLEQEIAFAENNIHLKGKTAIGEWLTLWERQYGSPLMLQVNPLELLKLRPLA